MDIESRFRDAVQSFWDKRSGQQQKQIESGKIDAGSRGAVTGGGHMAALELLVVDLLKDAGLTDFHIHTKTNLEIPGYYRPEKCWDLLVVRERQLLFAIEFKSQVGPSFGNNVNNRAEEAIGNTVDVKTAFREELLGKGPQPFLGYFFLLEDCPKVHTNVKNSEPHFPVDPEFKSASYSKRYEVLCRRLVLEGLYTGTCLTLATNANPTKISHPSPQLSFSQFAAQLQGAAFTFSKL